MFVGKKHLNKPKLNLISSWNQQRYCIKPYYFKFKSLASSANVKLTITLMEHRKKIFEHFNGISLLKDGQFFNGIWPSKDGEERGWKKPGQ